MALISILMVLAQAAGAPAADSIPVSVDTLSDSYLTRCLDMGELLDHDFDHVAYRLNAHRSDSIPMGVPVISLGRGVYLGNRRLPCIGPARILHRTDSTIDLGLDRRVEENPLVASKFPIVSGGVGLSFDGALTLHGLLPSLMNRSVDSVGAFIGQFQVQPNFDIAIYRMIGFRYSPGFGGDFTIPTDDDPAIELSYQETRYGPFLELPLRAFWKDAFPVSLRAGYLWIDGRLELNSDTLRQNLLGYSGHKKVHVDVVGRTWNYSVILGDQIFLQLDYYRRWLEFDRVALVSGSSMGFGLGFRL